MYKNNHTENTRRDAFRPSTGFSDLIKIVACYYEMYSRAATFVGPWIAKQRGAMMFMTPDKAQIDLALGPLRPAISYQARSAFTEAVSRFLLQTKGQKNLITPSPSSHHSAQFPAGTFEISKITDNYPILRDDKAIRKPAKTLHKIEFARAEQPVFIENLEIPAEQIQFVILRPKMGKLGMPSTSRWEVLLYKTPYGYLVEHVDSHLNPRWSGII